MSARRVWSYFWRFLNATSDEHRDTVDQGFGVTSGPCPPQSAQLLLRLGPLPAHLAARLWMCTQRGRGCVCVDDGVAGACTALGCAEPSVLCNPDPAPEMLYVMKGERSSAILDLHHDSASDTGLRFEDVNWRRHLSSLKPVGLTCLLGARDASTNAGTMASRRRSHGGPPRRRQSNGNQGTATTAIAAAAAGAEADTGTGTPAASGAVVGFPRRRRSFHTDSGVVGGDGVASSRRRLRSNSTTPALLASTRTAPLPRSHPSATTLLPPRRRGGSSYDTSPVLTAVTEGDAVATLALGNSNVQGQSSPARGYAFPVLVLVFHALMRTYVTCPRGMCVCVCCVCAQGRRARG